MKIALKCLVLLMAASTLILSGCAKNPDLAGGILYLSQKNFDKAVKALEAAVQQEPKNGEAHLKLGMAYAEIGETAKAGKEFDTALQLNPKLKKDVDTNRRHYWVEKFNEGIRLTNEERDFAKGAEEFQGAIDLDPGDVRAYTNLAFCLRQLGRHDEAVALFEKAAALNPADTASRKNLAAIYEEIAKNEFKEGRYSEAMTFYNKALEMEPERTSCLFQLGICYFEKASAETSVVAARPDYEKAVELYRRVIETDPTDVDAIFNMGIVYMALDDLDESIKLLKDAVDRDPKVREFHKMLGRAYARMGDQTLAVTEIVMSKALDPSIGKRMSDLDGWLLPDAIKARYSDTNDLDRTVADFGRPEEVFTYEESGSRVEAWFYWTKGIAFYFVNGSTPPKNMISFTPKATQ